MSNSPKLRSRLEMATNVAVLLVAVTVLGTYAWNYYRARNLTPQLQPGLQKGITLSRVSGIDYSDAHRTLLIAMNTHCSYCTASVPFYNRLAELQRNDSSAIHIISVFPNATEDVRQYAERNQLGLGTVAEANFGTLNLAGTPTMILVDSRGTVLDFWVGQLSAEAEQQVIQRLRT